ncbi:integrase [Saccharopolyspora gregorii]|uniref:Phage integrase family protein n=1 Tax=Saccharopolyspora gregorii TaxID=33914 RepID=A0ABP6RY18_9PSEU
MQPMQVSCQKDGHATTGLHGLVLCLIDLYTGARWGELAGQMRHEYDPDNQAIVIQAPLKEIGGNLFKNGRRVGPGGTFEDGAISPQVSRRRGNTRRKGRTKTPAGTRWVALPPSIAVLYETLLASPDHPFTFCTPEGHPWRRSNFRQRYWRPAWDGVHPDAPTHKRHVPAILSEFSFHEGRHTHNTWLTEDGVPEVARRARLGQKMKGIARVYDHVTPTMTEQLLTALEERFTRSVDALSSGEQAQLLMWFPRLRKTLQPGDETVSEDRIAMSSPFAI